MNRPTEKQIELFVRDPSSLHPVERVWVQQRIETDKLSKQLARWFRDYYLTLAILKESSSSDVDYDR